MLIIKIKGSPSVADMAMIGLRLKKGEVKGLLWHSGIEWSAEIKKG